MKKQRWRLTKGYWFWKCTDCGIWGFSKNKKCEIPKGWTIDGYGFISNLCPKCQEETE